MVKADVSAYKELFITESKEHLQGLNESLLGLERNPEEREHLNEMFRAAHTLKGMAGTMGYENISELAHKLENILGRGREGERIDKRDIDVLFECIDTLGTLIEDIASGKVVQRKLSRLYKKLDRILPNVKETPSIVPRSESLELTENERHMIESSKKSGLSCFRLLIGFSDKCTLKSARAMVVLKEIEAIGKIVKTIPNTKEIESERLGTQLEIVVTTRQDPNELKMLIEQIPDIEKVEVLAVALSKEAIKVGPTIRVSIERLQALQNLAEELAIAKLTLLQTASKFELSELDDISATIDRLTSQLQEKVLEMRLFPVDYLFSKFPRVVRDLGKKEKKDIDFIIEGKDIELDRLVLDEINAAVLHLLRNAVDHGIEKLHVRRKAGKDGKGRMKLTARREGNYVVIEVSDDGRGMDLKAIKKSAVERKLITKAEASKLSDADVFELLGTPGLSTTKKVTDLSGRGVGFNVVKSKIKSLGGSVRIQSKKGEGTKVELKLPLTTAIIQSLLVGVENEKYALPLESVRQIVALSEKDLKSIEKKEVIKYTGQVLPLLRLKNVLNVPGSPDSPDNSGNGGKLGPVLVVERNEKLFGLMVDSLIGQQETVVKPLEGSLMGRKEFSGATILGDGTVALILDVGGLIQ